MRPLLFILIQLERSFYKLYNDVSIKGGSPLYFFDLSRPEVCQNSSKFSSNSAAMNELFARKSLEFLADLDS